MSNKLIKRSYGFNEAKEWLRKKVEDEGGLNVTIELINKLKESGIEVKDMDELIDILSELSEDGYPIYRISRVCKGSESKGMMICSPTTVVAFTQNPEKDFSNSESETK